MLCDVYCIYLYMCKVTIERGCVGNDVLGDEKKQTEYRNLLILFDQWSVVQEPLQYWYFSHRFFWFTPELALYNNSSDFSYDIS